MKKLKVMTVFGTRPEAIKMAPLVNVLKNDEQIETIVCVTAQHREMLDQVLELFGIRPQYDLDIMKDRQTLTDITVRALKGLENVMEAERPDTLLVHGDTTTTFVAALAGFYHKTAVGHVEAGLRTYDKYSPYPEEINRRLTAGLSDLHFAPTAKARINLIEEGIDSKKIFVTGNTVIDALLETVKKEYAFSRPPLCNIDFQSCRVLLMTCHRRENIGRPMEEIFGAVGDIVKAFDDVQVIFPVHKNPAVRRLAAEILAGIERIHLIEPLDYLPFASLMSKSHIILTDSGGIQEEAPALGKPVLVLREVTERPEAVEAGTVKLAGVSRDAVFQMTSGLLQDREAYRAMAEAVNPYGDGKASERILEAIKYYTGISAQRPADFIPQIKG
jgi:UDP-N-acetylglucosamine 2-epimerase (non-hydrolysing)